MEKMDKQTDQQEKVAENKEAQKPKNDNGRPPHKQDEGPRKRRVDTPKTSPGVAELFLWATKAFDATSLIRDGYIAQKGRANVRQLTKSEVDELENLRLGTLLNLEPLCEINDDVVYAAISREFKEIPKELKDARVNSKGINDYRKLVIANYVELLLMKN
jgi:hypothetical protein